MMITEYIIIYDTMTNVVLEVNRRLAKGWQLYFAPSQNGDWFMQAMVKYRKMDDSIPMPYYN